MENFWNYSHLTNFFLAIYDNDIWWLLQVLSGKRLEFFRCVYLHDDFVVKGRQIIVYTRDAFNPKTILYKYLQRWVYPVGETCIENVLKD